MQYINNGKYMFSGIFFGGVLKEIEITRTEFMSRKKQDFKKLLKRCEKEGVVVEG